MTALAAWLPAAHPNKRLANVATQRAAYLALRTYARPPIGWRLVPHWNDRLIGCRAVRIPRADCFDKVSRLELIKHVHRRIVRLRTIFRLLSEERVNI